tara:strand:- start:20526 stop:21785 length:1260 start_codon:yes stop_codon:yes gene_type:complete
MKVHFDKVLANKIRNEILDHEETYEDGAWERFLTRKEKRKNRILYWYFTGIASSVLLFTSIVWIHQKSGHQPLDIQNPISIKEFPLPHSRLLDSISAKDNSNHFLKDIPITFNSNVSTSRDTIKLQNRTNYGLSLKTDSYGNISEKERSIVALTRAPIIYGNTLPNVVGKMDLLNAPFKNIDLVNEELTFHKKEKDIKGLGSKRRSVEIGFQISPSYGSNNGSSQALTSTNFGGGVTLNVPIKSSGFTFNTGVVFNELRLTNEESMLATSEASMEEDKFYKEETRMNSLDIPLNIQYRIPSKRIFFYIQAGMSSYVTFNENAVSTKTTFREVEVFYDVNGTTQSFRVKEAVSLKKESDYEGSKFHPLGTFNLSFGYKAPLTDRIKYEIQPFYKLPLNSLTTDNTKVPMGGISLKVSLTP